MAEDSGDVHRDTPVVSPELVACIQRIVAGAMDAHSAESTRAPAGTVPPTSGGTGSGRYHSLFFLASVAGLVLP